jgi:predicted PolB exonuclease-like 3'-5' exonuclease
LCIEVSHLKASAEKSALLLASRTDRFVAYQAWKEKEIKSLKAQAEKKVAALEKQHKFVLVREQAERYRMERSHMKEVISYARAIGSIHKTKE